MPKMARSLPSGNGGVIFVPSTRCGASMIMPSARPGFALVAVDHLRLAGAEESHLASTSCLCFVDRLDSLLTRYNRLDVELFRHV